MLLSYLKKSFLTLESKRGSRTAPTSFIIPVLVTHFNPTTWYLNLNVKLQIQDKLTTYFIICGEDF